MTKLLSYLAQVNVPRQDVKLPQPDFTDASLRGILQIVFGLIGAGTLIILIIQGIKFSVALGDSSQTAKARNSIIYAAVGLAISVLAFSIVSLVLRGVS